MDVNKYAYISTNTTTTICLGGAVLAYITIGETAAGAITIIDSQPTGDVTVGVLKSGVAEGTYKFNVAISGTLKITTAAASKLTVAYRPSGA